MTAMVSHRTWRWLERWGRWCWEHWWSCTRN